CLEYSSSPYSF
nr:immunoglobulin light chain junction region [Macaca mulatta]MOV63306.1 immunoglobulin light chain junction region [Macaca mulatta]MOV63774.1 immunoglobulin light chain junction region [Macaca mulatta]MOV64867.1 immunoglobulin light chain junction region [Macaca mulatta]MOV65522.1 immunoglobulin light chain junction region [Macaca mulatta]